MSNPASLQAKLRLSAPAPRVPGAVAGVLILWFASVFILGGLGLFATAPGNPPIPIFIGAVTPLVVFVAALRLSSAFRSFVLAVDLRTVMAIQAWRLGGLSFIALYTQGILPGLFAWPAGIGDIAIGLTAPWLVAALIRRPDFAASKLFVRWNLSGLLDLIVAVATATLSAMLATGAVGEASIAPMAQLPLVLIPAYLVPFFVMLHVAALMQTRQLRNHSRS